MAAGHVERSQKFGATAGLFLDSATSWPSGPRHVSATVPHYLVLVHAWCEAGLGCGLRLRVVTEPASALHTCHASWVSHPSPGSLTEPPPVDPHLQNLAELHAYYAPHHFPT